MAAQAALRVVVFACGSFVICSIALAQSFPTIRYTVTASSAQIPLPRESVVANGPYRYLGASPNGADVDPNFVLVAPSSGPGQRSIWIGLNPNVVPYLRPGGYGLAVRFAVDSPLNDTLVGFVNLRVLEAPPPTVNSVISAATLQPAISPGSLVTIFGSNIGTPPVTATYNDAGLYPTSLGNSTVTFNGVAAPLLYVSNTQINAIVPFEVAGQRSVEVAVKHNAPTSPAISVALADASPGIFTITQTGRGQGAVLNGDNTPNSDRNPVRKGSFVQMFCTGGGRWNPDQPSGSIYISAGAPRTRLPVSVKIGGQPVRVFYAGMAPYLVGVLQVNAEVPESVPSGAQRVELTVGDFSNSAQEVTIAVQ
jgi:uncharacterized protein (TIGR03437 family)